MNNTQIPQLLNCFVSGFCVASALYSFADYKTGWGIFLSILAITNGILIFV